MEHPFILVIDRSQWRCGGYIGGYGKGTVRLLNKEGYMCCLGFRCLAHNEELPILNNAHPGQVTGAPRKLKNTRFMDSAIDINDDNELSSEVREKKLAALAKRNGEEWIFVGDYETKGT